jgi:branched-chain amino acid transport system ATP-binding protein
MSRREPRPPVTTPGPVGDARRPLLQAQDLVRAFGAFRAVDGVSLDVTEGTIHAVIGPNGAGKTTLFRLLSGILRPTAGRLLLGGDDITRQRPHVIARRGLAQSFQMTSIFPRLTVLESVQSAILARRRRSGSLTSGFRRSTAGEAERVLGRVGLADRSGAEARTLSHGDQRALDVALALATRPRLLLLDEPTAGMSAAETSQTIRLIADLVRAEGLTVLFSEHDMDIVFGISQRVTVLHQGRVIADGSAAQVRADQQVIAVYLGGDEPVEAQ